MVNPLFILSALNASTEKATRNGCYEQNPPGETQLVPTTFTVCSQAINHMSTSHALDEPLAFGRSVKVGHKVPDWFVHKGFYGSCVVEIDMKQGGEDTLTWRDIIVSASSLRDLCVAVPPHLGGEAKAGPRQLLDVMIYGLSKEIGLAVPGGSSGLVQGRTFDA